MNHILFSPYGLSELTLRNRIVMAPLTRRRSTQPGLTANEMMALYYKQRATAGLIIAEASQISPFGYGYTGSPGCHTSEQTEKWKIVTDAIHQEKGHIFLQLWHVGPFSHASIQPEGKAPLAASVVRPEGEILTPSGHKTFGYSRAMTIDEINSSILDFGKAAQNALLSGFDGVEIHAAHAYLIDQFIMHSTNKRTDEFGGTLENRTRFLFMVLDEVLKHTPSESVGIRLSPSGVRPGMKDSNPQRTYGYITERLNDYKLAYLHISEHHSTEERLVEGKSIVPYYRSLYKGNLISCGGHSLDSALLMIDRGEADLIAFGKSFISNPDLVKRLRDGGPLANWDKDLFYHGDKKGYTDYPFWEI